MFIALQPFFTLIHLHSPPVNQIVSPVRNVHHFAHRPRNDLVVQGDVGDQFVVSQQGLLNQAVARRCIGFFSDAFDQCVLLWVAEAAQIKVAVTARTHGANQ